MEGERWVEQARRGSISRLGFYTLEEQRRPPAGSSKGRVYERIESKISWVLQERECYHLFFRALRVKALGPHTRVEEGGQG